MAKERCSAYVPRVIGPFPENVEDLDVIGGYLPDLGEAPIPDNQDILMFIEEEKRANGVRMIECFTVEDANRLLEMVPNRRNPMNAFLLHLQRPIQRNWVEPFRGGQMTFLLRLQQDGSVISFPINREAIFELFDRDDARPREIEEMDVPPQVKEQARAEWREEFGRRLQALINANRQNAPAVPVAQAPVNHQEEIRRDVEILRRLIFDENYDQLRELIRHGIDFGVISEILPELFRNGRRNIIEMFLDGGIMHENILYNAVRTNDVHIVRRCIELGMRFDEALNNAVQRASIEIIRLLVENRFRSDFALLEAIERGRIDIIRLLLENDMRINDNDIVMVINRINDYDNFNDIIALLQEHNVLGDTRLYLAIKDRDVNLIRRLIQEGNRGDGLIDLINAAIETRDIEIVRILYQNDIGNAQQREDGLIKAMALPNNLEIAEMLVEEFRIVSNDALDSAIYENLHRIVRALLDNGARIGRRHFSLNNVNLDILELLLERGIEIPNATELYMNVRRNNIEAVRRLLQGQNNDAENNSRVLIAGIKTHNVNMVRLLLENGFGNDQQRTDGLTTAIKSNDLPMVRMLVEDFDIRDNYMIIIAVRDEVNIEIIRYLAQQGMRHRIALNYARNVLHDQELVNVLEH